jgi:hypothetical protein
VQNQGNGKRVNVHQIGNCWIFAAGSIFASFKQIYTPTTGAKISKYANPQKALLVIDVQEDYTGLKGKLLKIFQL